MAVGTGKKMKMTEEVYVPAQSADLPINSVVSIAIVTDPHSDRGAKIQVVRAIRDDPLAGMLSRQQIDQAQFEAGRKWQKLHENSTIGVIRAIDPAKEAVDGGELKDFLTDRQIEAFKELTESNQALGSFGSKLIFEILAKRKSISEAADYFDCRTDLEVKYIGRRFRECLETLAVFWGFAPPKYQNT